MFVQEWRGASFALLLIVFLQVSVRLLLLLASSRNVVLASGCGKGNELQIVAAVAIVVAAQPAHAWFLCIVAAQIHTLVRPFEQSVDNWLESVSLAVLTVISVQCGCLIPHSDVNCFCESSCRSRRSARQMRISHARLLAFHHPCSGDSGHVWHPVPAGG